jgi:hypothetical protein
MIFDKLGLPKDNGATDLQDSARLAGLLTTFGWAKRMSLELYVDKDKKRYVRHPEERTYDFSRDQAICLIAGLYFSGKRDLVKREYVDGKDIFSPSHMGHVRMCQGLKPRWYQKAWLWIDVLYGCFYQPMGEPNQLLCMLMVADRKYLKFWLKYNKHWQASIKEYWAEGAGAWRKEPELAAHMIKVLENV